MDSTNPFGALHGDHSFQPTKPRQALGCQWGNTLERWRTEGIGPKYLKLCGRVLYRLVDIEEYECACLMSSTSKAVAV